jgi:hypothetical protein
MFVTDRAANDLAPVSKTGAITSSIGTMTRTAAASAPATAERVKEVPLDPYDGFTAREREILQMTGRISKQYRSRPSPLHQPPHCGDPSSKCHAQARPTQPRRADSLRLEKRHSTQRLSIPLLEHCKHRVVEMKNPFCAVVLLVASPVL